MKITVPRVIFTEPEIAHIGAYSYDLDKAGIKYDTYTKFYEKLTRARLEEQKGMIKILTKENSDEILGATIVGGPASELIITIASAMKNGLGLQQIGECVYTHPGWSQSIKHISDKLNRTFPKLVKFKSIVPGSRKLLASLVKWDCRNDTNLSEFDSSQEPLDNLD